jgi:hypothetical protein
MTATTASGPALKVRRPRTEVPLCKWFVWNDLGEPSSGADL